MSILFFAATTNANKKKKDPQIFQESSQVWTPAKYSDIVLRYSVSKNKSYYFSEKKREKVWGRKGELKIHLVFSLSNQKYIKLQYKNHSPWRYRTVVSSCDEQNKNCGVEHGIMRGKFKLTSTVKVLSYITQLKRDECALYTRDFLSLYDLTSFHWAKIMHPIHTHRRTRNLLIIFYTRTESRRNKIRTRLTT